MLTICRVHPAPEPTDKMSARPVESGGGAGRSREGKWGVAVGCQAHPETRAVQSREARGEGLCLELQPLSASFPVSSANLLQP